VKLRSPVFLIAAILWCAAILELAVLHDWMIFAIALGFATFLLLAWYATIRLVPEAAAPPADVLRAVGPRPRVTARTAVVLVCAALLFIHGFSFEGIHVLPALDRFYRAVYALAPWLGTALPNFVIEALIPGLLVIGLGARLREIGLSRPARGTLLAIAACTGLFVLSWIFRFAQGHLTVSALALYLMHNVLGNGFSEEFSLRGLIMSHLRAYLRTDWALLTQASLFALLHVASSLHDEPTALGIVANVIALNLPMGIVMGLMALRTRSIALPAVLHTVLDTQRNVFS
jgi:membrane protease YdiL (CAAX protease family)